MASETLLLIWLAIHCRYLVELLSAQIGCCWDLTVPLEDWPVWKKKKKRKHLLGFGWPKGLLVDRQDLKDGKTLAGPSDQPVQKSFVLFATDRVEIDLPLVLSEDQLGR